MTALAKAPLGRTGLQVTRLGFGALELRGPYAGAQDRRGALALLNGVLDEGINFIDTAPDYGASESLIGEALAGRRSEFVLASKCGCPTGSDEERVMDAHAHSYTRANVRRGVEDSLRRLRTDHLDLVQVHLSPARAELEREGTVEELQRLRQEGKVRFIGMSGTLPHLADHIAMGCFDVFQVPYSVLEPGHDAAITQAAAAGAGVVVRGSVWRGRPFFRRGWRQRLVEGLRGVLGRPNQWQALGLDELRGEMPVREFLLRFTLSHPGQSTTIVGTSRLAHLRANVEAARKGPLPPELLARVRRAVLKAA